MALVNFTDWFFLSGPLFWDMKFTHVRLSLEYIHLSKRETPKRSKMTKSICEIYKCIFDFLIFNVVYMSMVLVVGLAITVFYNIQHILSCLILIEAGRIMTLISIIWRCVDWVFIIFSIIIIVSTTTIGLRLLLNTARKGYGDSVLTSEGLL